MCVLFGPWALYMHATLQIYALALYKDSFFRLTGWSWEQPALDVQHRDPDAYLHVSIGVHVCFSHLMNINVLLFSRRQIDDR